MKKKNSYKELLNITDVTEYEDLFQFEYTDDNKVFDDAVRMWYIFLRTFGEIKEPILREVLKKYKNSRQPRPSFNDIVFNFDEVKGAINDSIFIEYLME